MGLTGCVCMCALLLPRCGVRVFAIVACVCVFVHAYVCMCSGVGMGGGGGGGGFQGLKPPPLFLVEPPYFGSPSFITDGFKVCFVLEVEFCVLKKNWSPPPPHRKTSSYATDVCVRPAFLSVTVNSVTLFFLHSEYQY